MYRLSSLFCLPVIFLMSCSLFNLAEAQVDKKHNKQYISVEWEQELLSMLDAQLAKSGEAPLHFYFLEKIETHCKDDLDCQWDSYWVVMDEANALKLYLQCIPLTEKLLDLAKARGDEKVGLFLPKNQIRNTPTVCSHPSQFTWVL